MRARLFLKPRLEILISQVFFERGAGIAIRFQHGKRRSIAVNYPLFVEEINSRFYAVQDDDGLAEEVDVDDVGLCICVKNNALRCQSQLSDKLNSLYSSAHFANCTHDLSAGTCRRLPMMGDPLGPGGSGYFDFEPCELYNHNPTASNIIPPPKTAKPQLQLRLRRASGNEFMMSVCNYSFFLTDTYLKSVPEICHSILELYNVYHTSV